MKNEITTISNEDIAIIKKQFFPQNAQQDDVNYCLSVANSLGLNPIAKEIWFVERKANINGQWVTKIEPMAGRDSYIKVAHRSGKFGGIEAYTELRDVPVLNNGNWETKKDLVGIAKVYKVGIDKPFLSEVNYSEYVQKKKDNTPTKFWAEKPHTMIKKVAESQALRKAFNITGVYDDAEIREDDSSEIVHDAVIETPKHTKIDEAKSKLVAKLKSINYDMQNIKEFAKYHNLENDLDRIEILLSDDEAFNNAVANFENPQG